MEKPKKPKKPAPPTRSRLSANALVETIDGPVEILTLVGKVMPVTTRFADGTIGFRMMINIREIAAEAALLRFQNQDGQSLVVGAEHVFVAADGSPITADAVVEGSRQTRWSRALNWRPVGPTRRAISFRMRLNMLNIYAARRSPTPRGLSRERTGEPARSTARRSRRPGPTS